jgi:predicted transcriptional regulator
MPSSIRLQRWNDVLIAISKARNRQCYCERLYKIIQCSRTHMREIVAQLLDENLIEITPSRKIKYLELTDKGKRVIDSLQTINSELTHSRPEI